MTQKVVLLDLENNVPTAKLLREIVEHYPTLYLFHCQGQFEYALQDLTELAAWISSGQVVILDTPKAEQKELIISLENKVLKNVIEFEDKDIDEI